MNRPANGNSVNRKPRPHSPLSDHRGYGAFEHHIAGELSLAELWHIIIKRRSTFFLCLGSAVALAILAYMILPVRYEGVARLTLDFDSNALQDAVANMSGGTDGADLKLQTQVKVLESDSLAWQVIKNLRVDQRPEAAHRILGVGPAVCLSGPGQPVERVTQECRYLLLKEFHRRYKVQALPRTQIIEIRYRSRSRELAAQVVNAITDEYTRTSFQAKYGAALRASKWVSGQLDEAKNNAQKAEEKFIAYQKQTGIIGTDENHNVLIERLDAINQQLVVAEASRIVREARYRESLNGDPEALVEMAPGSPLLVLHAEQATLQSEYAQLETKFGESYPRVQQLKAQLDKATTSLNAEIARSRQSIQSEYEAALKGEQLLRKEFEEQKQQAYDTSEATVQVALLKRDVDASRDLYEQLVKQLNESGILAGLRSTNVTVIDAATVPVEQAEPNLRINLVFGVIAGTLLGLGLCFLRENLNSTILTPHDISDASTLPVIGVVPRLTDKNALGKDEPTVGTARIAALERPDGVVAEAYRSLRTALLLSSATAPPKVLLITSALPREGKTTTSINLAAVFSQKEQRVLLVDGDLRRADLYRGLGLPHGDGLSAALTGQDHRQFYAQRSDLPNLFVLPAGVRPPKPPDLLDSERMRELLAMWREEFDRVIIDAPPVIGLSDSVILSTMVDAVVLVLRANQSLRQDFNLAQEILTGVNANICGAIINDFHLSRSYASGYSDKLYGNYFDEKGKKGAHG